MWMSLHSSLKFRRLNRSYEEQLKDLSMWDWKGEDNKLQQLFQCWPFCERVNRRLTGYDARQKNSDHGWVFIGGHF